MSCILADVSIRSFPSLAPPPEGLFFGAEMNLTEHFTYKEFTDSATAQRLGIDNIPSQAVEINLGVLANGLELVRSLLGFHMHINDAYRCEALERVLARNDFIGWCRRHGKEEDSESWAEYFALKAHPQGFAADFTCAQFGTPEQIVRAIKASGLPVDQCICEGTWVHISFAPELRGRFMVAVFKDGIPEYRELV